MPESQPNEPQQPKRRLRILISILYYVPHYTGYTIHVRDVAEALAARGHEVTVLCARHSLDLPRDETINGVRIVRLWAPIRLSRGMIMPLYPLALLAFMRKVDLIFANSPALEPFLNAIISRLVRKPLVITHHGDLILPPGIKNRLIQGLTFTLFKVAARRAARLIGYSRDYADHSYYLTPFKDKVAVNYPPIHMPPPDPERADELRADWQRDGGILIGYCGRFVQEKRPDVLIRSLDVILKTHPNARIVFAGQYNIPYEDTWQVYQPLIETYRDHLIFLGIITSREALANFYAALDVFVLPSDTECFALVQVEAMLCGAPVVMTDTPGGRVPVTVTGMGKIVPRGDHQTMGRAVIDIVANRAAYVKPRHEIERIFNFEETIATYERHFREAVEG